jgi:hypothetical protein
MWCQVLFFFYIYPKEQMSSNDNDMSYEVLVERLDEMGYSIYEEAADRRDDLTTGKNIGAIGVAAAALLGGPVGWGVMALPLAVSGGAYLISVARASMLTGKLQAIPFSKESLLTVAIKAASGETLMKADQNTDPVTTFMSAGERAIWTLTSRQVLGEYLATSIWGDYEERGVPITPSSIKRALIVAIDAFERNPKLIEDPIRTIALRGKENFATEFFNGLRGVAPDHTLNSEEVDPKKASALLPLLQVEGAPSYDVEFEEIEIDDLIPDSGNYLPTISMGNGEDEDEVEVSIEEEISDPEEDETIVEEIPIEETVVAPIMREEPPVVREHRDERTVNISKEMISPVKSTIILGKPGSGKGYSTSNAVALLISQEPEWEIWFVDPKNDPNEGYFDSFLPPSRMFKRRLPSAIDETALDEWVEDSCYFISKFQASLAPKKLLIWDECTNSIAKLGVRFKKYIVPELVDIATMGRSSNSYVWMMGQSDGLADWGITGGSRDVFRRVALINQVKGDPNCDSSFSSGRTTFFQQTPLPGNVGRISNRVAYDSQRLNSDTSHGWVPIYSEGPIRQKRVSKASVAAPPVQPAVPVSAVSPPVQERDPWEEVHTIDKKVKSVATEVEAQLKNILEYDGRIYISRLKQKNASLRSLGEDDQTLALEEVMRGGYFKIIGKEILRILE